MVILGFVAHLGVGFVVLVSGLIMPLWAILALGAVWAVGLVVMIRRRSSPLAVWTVPVLTLGLWALTGWAGERLLDWTA
jgi:isoprenylcysteine carboxyl methyltransferase (ICMT) family protein YpbQ